MDECKPLIFGLNRNRVPAAAVNKNAEAEARRREREARRKAPAPKMLQAGGILSTSTRPTLNRRTALDRR